MITSSALRCVAAHVVKSVSESTINSLVDAGPGVGDGMGRRLSHRIFGDAKANVVFKDRNLPQHWRFVRLKLIEASSSPLAQHVLATVLRLLDRHRPTRELV